MCVLLESIAAKDLPSIRSVDADSVSLCRVVSNIFNVAKNMSSSILGNEVAQICAQTHVCDSRFVVTPFLHWEALE